MVEQYSGALTQEAAGVPIHRIETAMTVAGAVVSLSSPDWVYLDADATDPDLPQRAPFWALEDGRDQYID